MPGFEDKDFIEDIIKIFASNNFMKTYRAENEKVLVSDCFKMAKDYLGQFYRPDDTGKQINYLTSLLGNFQSFQSSIEEAGRLTYGSEGYKKCINIAKTQFYTLVSSQPPFQTLMKEFLSQAGKGSSYGDDGLRMLTSMVQNMDDIAVRYKMQKSLDTTLHWDEHYGQFKKSEKEFDKFLDIYVEECNENEFIGHKLDVNIKSDVALREKYEKELALVTSEDYKKTHTEEYNNVSAHMTDNREKDRKLEAKEDLLKERLNLVEDLENRLTTMQPEIEQKRTAFNAYTRKQSNINKEISDIDKDIARLSTQSERFEKAQSFLDNMDWMPKNRLRSANYFAHENVMLGIALKTMDALNSNEYEYRSSSISQAYRECKENSENYQKQDPEDKIAIDKYIETKKQLIDIDPTLEQKFMEYEDNPKNMIPGDFDKVIGKELKNRIKQHSEYIKEVQGEPFYKQYVEARNTIIECKTETNTIEGLKAQKEELKKELEEVNERVQESKESLVSWKKLFKNAMGDKFPRSEMMTVQSVKRTLNSERIKLNNEIGDIRNQRTDINKQMREDSKKLVALKEGLEPAKAEGIQEKIDNIDKRLKKASHLVNVKNMATEGMTSTNKKRDTLSNTAKEALTAPYTLAKSRLENIYKHFKDVQSFFSKGMSPECKDMYSNLGVLIGMLDGKSKTNVKNETIISQFQTVKTFAKDYYDAKKNQNIPKIFTSEQRHWRLAKTEELMGVLDSTISVLTKIEESKNLSKMETFVKESEQIAKQDPNKMLDDKISSKQLGDTKNKNVGIEAAQQQLI